MSEAVLIVLISTLGLILSGVLVELVRARKRQDTVVEQVNPANGGSSMRDLFDRMAADVREIRVEQARVKTNLAVVETRISDYMLRHPPPFGGRPRDDE